MTNHKVKYALCCIFYNDVKGLERCLRSFSDKVDLMFCIDGKFKHFNDKNAPDSSGLSYDGSRELVTSFDNSVLMDVPNSYEIQKRTAYLKLCEYYKSEYAIIADSDEYVYEPDTDWALFDNNVDEFCNSFYYGKYNIFGIYTEVDNPTYNDVVPIITGRQKQHSKPPVEKKRWKYLPRLWHRPYEMEYNETHYQFRNKIPGNPLNKEVHNATVRIIPGLYIGHDHVLRSKEFLRSRFEYQKWLVPFEQKKIKRFREVFGRLPKDYDEIDKWEPISQAEAIQKGLFKIK